MKNDDVDIPENALFATNCDFVRFNRIVRDSQQVNEFTIQDEVVDVPSILRKFTDNQLPLFIRSAKTGDIRIIPSHHEGLEAEKGDAIAYLGELM